jgi:hypothetical protein
MRRFLPLRDVWRVSREVGAASTEAAEQRARKFWMKRLDDMLSSIPSLNLETIDTFHVEVLLFNRTWHLRCGCFCSTLYASKAGLIDVSMFGVSVS